MPILGLLPNSEDESVASGLLQLANNDIETALDLYQSCTRDRDMVLQKCSELNAKQGVVQRNLSDRKRPRVVVDDLALASLESMGVEKNRARRALEESNNDIDNAIAWLTRQNENTCSHGDASSGSQSEEEDTNKTPASSNTVAPETASDVFSTTNEQAITAEGDDQKGIGTGAAINDGPLGVVPTTNPEREAFRLLERVLGEILEDQNKGNDDYLGNSLEEEWVYIEQYRGSS